MKSSKDLYGLDGMRGELNPCLGISDLRDEGDDEQGLIVIRAFL